MFLWGKIQCWTSKNILVVRHRSLNRDSAFCGPRLLSWSKLISSENLECIVSVRWVRARLSEATLGKCCQLLPQFGRSIQHERCTAGTVLPKMVNPSRGTSRCDQRSPRSTPRRSSTVTSGSVTSLPSSSV